MGDRQRRHPDAQVHLLELLFSLDEQRRVGAGRPVVLERAVRAQMAELALH